jgi:hypothetical protein
MFRLGLRHDAIAGSDKFGLWQILLSIRPLHGPGIFPKTASLILTSPTDRSLRCSHPQSDRYAKDLVEVSAAQISIKGKSQVEAG